MGFGDIGDFNIVSPIMSKGLQPGGGDIYSSETLLPSHVRAALGNLGKMLSASDKESYFNPEFDYWGRGKLPAWREQLMGATKTASNPILKAVSDQVESDFARRGLTTGGAAGAAKARAMIDTAARLVLPIEQQLVSTEQQGIKGKYDLQQYAMNLAMGAPTLGGMEQAPYKPTFLGGLIEKAAGGFGQAAGTAAGAAMFV